jgi:hypothetical protein
VNGEFRYVIVNPPWCATNIAEFMKVFDKIHLSSRFTSMDRPKRGAFPHRRFPSRRVDRSSEPVPSLPVNFYEPIWLNSLSEFKLCELDVQPPVDLSFTPSVTTSVHVLHSISQSTHQLFHHGRLAARFWNVIDHTTKPLPRNDPSLPFHVHQSNSNMQPPRRPRDHRRL